MGPENPSGSSSPKTRSHDGPVHWGPLDNRELTFRLATRNVSGQPQIVLIVILVVAPSAKAVSDVLLVSARVALMQQRGDIRAKILLMRLQELAMSDVAHERRNEESRS